MISNNKIENSRKNDHLNYYILIKVSQTENDKACVLRTQTHLICVLSSLINLILLFRKVEISENINQRFDSWLTGATSSREFGEPLMTQTEVTNIGVIVYSKAHAYHLSYAIKNFSYLVNACGYNGQLISTHLLAYPDILSSINLYKVK